MKNKLMLFVLVVVGLLAGCAAPKPLPTGKVDPAKSALQVKLQSTINEGRRILIDVDRTIGFSARTSIFTADEAAGYAKQATDYRKTLDNAQTALDTNGDIGKAFTDADVTAKLADKFLQELVARANAGKKTWNIEDELPMPMLLSA